tara:strand:- start:2580 stop:2819 length:240 start_codon:yes stop_codon:yes gene_type:complete
MVSIKTTAVKRASQMHESAHRPKKQQKLSQKTKVTLLQKRSRPQRQLLRKRPIAPNKAAIAKNPQRVANKIIPLQVLVR